MRVLILICFLFAAVQSFQKRLFRVCSFALRADNIGNSKTLKDIKETVSDVVDKTAGFVDRRVEDGKDAKDELNGKERTYVEYAKEKATQAKDAVVDAEHSVIDRVKGVGSAIYNAAGDVVNAVTGSDKK